MTEEQKKKIKEKFEEGKYDIIPFLIDNDLVEINLNSYEGFCIEVIKILNEVRINREISDEEIFYPYEEFFANRFYESMYRALIKNEKLEELPQEVLEKLKKFYHMITDVNNFSMFLEDEDEKIK